MYWGYGLYALGAAAAGTAPVLVAADQSSKDYGKVLIAAAPLASAILFVIAKGFIAREEAASELAKQAGESLLLATPSEQNDGCVKALAHWDGSRNDAAKIAGSLEGDLKEEKANLSKEKANLSKEKEQLKQETENKEKENKELKNNVNELYDASTPQQRAKLDRLFPWRKESAPSPAPNGGAATQPQ